MTEIPDTPWAEACAAMVPESLLTLLLKRSCLVFYTGGSELTLVPIFLLILHCWAIDNNELVNQ
jgi:hypothetical protein